MDQATNSTWSPRSRFHLFFDYFAFFFKAWICAPLTVFLGLFVNIIIMVAWLSFKQGDPFLLAAVVGTGIIRNGGYTFIRTMLNIKRAGAYDRLRAVPTSKRTEIIASLCSNFLINVAISIILICIALILFPAQRTLFLDVNWAMFLTGYLILWVSSIIFAFILYYGFRNPEDAQAAALVVYVISYLFFGCAFPFATIAKVEWLNIVLYIFTQRYALNVLQAGWVNATHMHYVEASGTHVDWGFGGHLYIPYIVSIAVLTMLSIILIMIYRRATKWRKKDQYGINLLQMRGLKYIKLLKKASSIAEIEQIRADFQRQERHDFRDLRRKTKKIRQQKQVKVEN